MAPSPRDVAPSPLHVLYIDDDEALLELTRSFLERTADGITVDTTSTPREGLALLESDDYDVVVCDYQMPEMDGLAVLETLRTEYDDDVPFIIFTGEGREAVAIEALNLGANRYLQKGGDPTAQYGVLAQAIEQEAAHHRTRAELRAREENLRVTLESIGDAVITTDVDGRITRLNSVAESLTGWDRADAVGRPLSTVFDIISQESREPEPSPAEEVIAEGRTIGLANGTILIRKDGSERYIADSAAPIETAEGALVGVVLVFRDVTETYQAQTRQRRQRRALMDLAVAAEITRGDIAEASRTITETAAATLDVDRVSIWLFEDDRTELRCIDQYDRSGDAHTAGDVLCASTAPDYFEAVTTHRAIDADEARTDARTSDLHDDYLAPRGIASLLDAPIRVDGEVVGILCHEQTGSAREWTEDEQRFAAEVTDHVQRMLTNEQRAKREAALRSLHGIATEITALESRKSICERTVAAAETILEFDLCVINLEADGLLPIMATSAALPPGGVTTMSVEEGIAGKTYRTGESFLFDDARTIDEANPQGDYRAGISVPIGDHGVFQAVSMDVGAFDADDRDLVELLVSHAARALDRLEIEAALRSRTE